MKFTGKTDEFLELSILQETNCPIFKNPEASSLTILWFETDDNQLTIDGKEYLFHKNQIVFLTEFHKVEIVKKQTIKYLRFNRSFYCIIDHDEEVSCNGLLFFGSSQLPIIDIPLEELEHFNLLWKMFCIEMDSKDSLQISMLQMMLKRYLILCTRIYKTQHQFKKDKKENDLIRAYNFLVEKHFKTNHTVAEYAEMLHKSPKTLANVFSKSSQKSPLSYIHDRKILEARRLLHYTDMQIQEVAYEIGYNDIQTFSRFFKKHEGISPTQFKKKKRMG